MAEKDLETTWLTDNQFGAVTRAMYHNFKDIPTGEGVSEIPPGIYALGALAGFHDFGLENTEVEIEYIFEKLKRWYPTPEIYLTRFTEYEDRVTHEPITKEMVEEFVRIMTGKPNFFTTYQQELDKKEKEELQKKAQKNSMRLSLDNLPVFPQEPISVSRPAIQKLPEEFTGIKPFVSKNSGPAAGSSESEKKSSPRETGQELSQNREEWLTYLNDIDNKDSSASEKPETGDS